MVKKLLCALLIAATGGCLYGQNETTDTVEAIDHSGLVESFSDEDADRPLISADVMPQFEYMGCTDTKESVMNYVADSIRIPSGDCRGEVEVIFVVERDSTVSDIEILGRLPDCPGYKEEIIRLFTSMPLWTPGRQYGKPARVKLIMPVDFLPKK